MIESRECGDVLRGVRIDVREHCLAGQDILFFKIVHYLKSQSDQNKQ